MAELDNRLKHWPTVAPTPAEPEFDHGHGGRGGFSQPAGRSDGAGDRKDSTRPTYRPHGIRPSPRWNDDDDVDPPPRAA